VQRRSSLAYQLCRVNLYRYQLAALVSAVAFTSYASHSTDLSLLFLQTFLYCQSVTVSLIVPQIESYEVMTQSQ